MPAKFAHLHVHSHYSLLSALPKIPDLVAAAKREGVDALALTDFDNLYGAIEFVKECGKEGIKPIIGLDTALAGSTSRLLLYAKNADGYKNLLSLVTTSRMREGEAMLSLEEIAAHAEHLIAVSPFRQGDVAAALRAREPARALEAVKKYRKIFGNENVYIQLSRTESEDGEALFDIMRDFARENALSLVAGQEIFYLLPEDRRAWTVMRAIENRGPADEGDITAAEDQFFFRSAKEMAELFADCPEALENTLAIAERCSVELKLGSWVFPDFPIPEGSTYDAELRTLIEEGLKRRKLVETPELRERIEYEFKVISDKGYSPYFLVVADLLRFARTNGILTTIRGSVAGSMVTYVTGITNVNPIDYGIPFERFLNPERPSAPDIDMDYADNRRDEVIEYARRKYGADHVAQIGTFGTMLARGVVRDVARAMGYAYGVGDRIAKEIPMGSQGFPMTLDRALEENPELAKLYKGDRDVREIIDLGKKIEGCARHISVHAAGVVIAPKPLVEFAPIQKDPKGGKLITQYDMHSVEDAGLLKFDFLGIRNLAILAHAVELVQETRGTEVDIENIPLDDQKTFDMLTRGETEGLFQLNGSGMTRFLKDLRPSTIHDINAMVALYRPGPMDMIPTYIERKHNPKLVSYLDPRMREFLGASYGLLVYQDDVLLTSIKLAGYSWLEADKLRKAMGKKIPEVMQAEKEKLIKGFKEYGKLTPNLADRLWKLIEPFAAYGFGKAHAASYGKVAYQTAYMKANFPVEYMAAILTAEAGDIETISIMVNECKRMGIPVLPPDVNESYGHFAVLLGANGPRTEKAAALAGDVEHDSIRFGLYSIKNFGSNTADAIIAERKRGGRFTSLSDFLTRIKDQALNKKSLEALIKSGALDSLGDRGVMLAGLDKILEFYRESGRETAQDSLFATLGSSDELRLPDAPPMPIEERLASEKELLGLYISGHPLDRIKDKLAKRSMTIPELREKLKPGMTAVAAGMIEDVRTILTRGGDQMAFIKIADYNGSIEAVVFPKSFTEHKDLIKPDSCIALKGRLSNRNGEISLVTEALKAL